jgi:tetratricopeptide (TPR) repeat protein
MCEFSQAALAGALDVACRARLLEEEGEADYRFAHDVIREVVERDLGAARRAVLHQRAGEALAGAAGPAPVEALAYHFARADDPERAVLYLEQAGDRARQQHAQEAAAGYYRELIARLDCMDRPDVVARACEKLGGVLVTLARHDEALVALERAAAHHSATGDLEVLGCVTAQIGLVLGQIGATEEGLARLQPLLAQLEARAPTSALAELYTAQSQLYMYLYLFQEELTPATRAVELARALRDARLLTRALTRQGYALISAGQVVESLRTLEEARRLAESVGDLASLCRAHDNASDGHYALGELEASVRCAEQALDIARRLDDPLAIAGSLAKRGRSAFLMGDWSQARADLEGAVALARQGPITATFLTPSALLGECYLAAGEWDAATGYLHEIVTVTERYGMVTHGRFRHAQGLLAEIDLYCGRPEAARDRLLPLAADENTFATWMRTQLAWAYLELGEVDRAAELVARALAQGRFEKHLVRLVDALRVQAMVLARQGQLNQAASALDEGLTLTPAMPYPYGEARLLHVYGLLHRQRGEPQAARQRLGAALAIFRRLGARKDSERTEQLLASLG